MPDWSSDVRARLERLRLSPAREAEIVEELSQHLDERYQELRDSGIGEAQARTMALEELCEADTLARHMQRLCQTRTPEPVVVGRSRGKFLNDLWHDLRYAARMLRKQPGFTLAAVSTLALGIGANTAIFSLVNATLLRRLPVANRERLVYIGRNNTTGAFSYRMYAALRDGNRSFDGVAAWANISASLNVDNTAELAEGAIVTGNLFEALGVKPEHGRLLTPADDVAPGAHPVAVVSHEFWRTRFGGRLDVLGREIKLNGHVFTIVGVTPAGFTGPELGIVRSLYVPMMMQAIARPPSAGYSGEMNPDLLQRPGGGWLSVVGLLKAGAAAEPARAELEALATTYARDVNLSPPAVRVFVAPVDDGNPVQRRQMQSVALLLSAVVGAVLLIACANIANLLLSRTAARRREIAVRLAIGASPARIVRQLLTESMLLAFIGGGIGVALAGAVVRAFDAAPPPPGALPLALDFSIDLRVLLFTMALSFITGIVFGLVPALKASRPGLVPALKDASADGGERGRRFDLKRVLVVAEVALSLMLLIASGLFVRSLQAAQAIDPGFDVDQLASARLNINLLRYTSAQGREFYREVVARMERLPGVESASVARVPVIGNGFRVIGMLKQGSDALAARQLNETGSDVTSDPSRVNANVIGPGFFKTLGIPLLKGRDFDQRDIDGRPPVVIVNETAVRQQFAGKDPVGARVSFSGPPGPWCEIVGVVRDSKYASLGEPALPVVYMPVAQNHETGMTLYVRASVSPASLITSIRREIQNLDPNLPIPAVQTMSQTIGVSLYAARMGAWLLGVFGSLALLLAVIGIYGVLSFTISRRTREMGIRLALGAEKRDVFLLVVRDGMLLVVLGIFVGLGGGLLGTRSLAGFLYSVPTSDIPTFSVMTTVLVVVALAACMIPARRAMRVPPSTALRCE
jgi:macrolide transport system ATP-binding/permease protein